MALFLRKLEEGIEKAVPLLFQFALRNNREGFAAKLKHMFSLERKTKFPH
jgi:hypothetical protein